MTRRSQVALFRGADRGKDQSYFLFALSQRTTVAHTMFPLGEMHKTEVREQARRLDCRWPSGKRVRIFASAITKRWWRPTLNESETKGGDVVDRGG